MIKQKNDKGLKSTERKGETKVQELLLSSRVGPEGKKEKGKEKELKTAVASQTERETTVLIL